MIEKSKWQRELVVFSRLVNTIILTGNINDQHPIVNESKQRIRGFCSLSLYLAHTCQSLGYQAVLFYTPVDGFYSVNGLQQKTDVLELVERVAREAQNGGQDGLGLTRRKSAAGNASLAAESMESAAYIMDLILTQSSTSIAVIVSFSSRMLARPDDLDMDERMIFMYFQEGAVNARKNHAGNPAAADYQDNPVIQNQLFLIADKINDLPAWYYLSHPSLKIIDIPRPDYHVRSQIIAGYSTAFPGFSEASDEERKLFHDAFVGATEGFTTQDIARVFQIARFGKLDIHGIDNAILLYKHGVRDNPWMKLDACRLAGAEEQIGKRVIGQDPVVKVAVDIVKRAAMGMSGLQHSASSSKPRGILFLAGPTGTGKTELAKALTELIFLDESNMIRFDMSEYRQEQSDQRLLGAPPGYVGYDEGGQLTEAVRRKPYSVVLFDEIEKAHPDVFNILLQVLDDGRLTDNKGRMVNFKNTIIIMTSNMGSSVIRDNFAKMTSENKDEVVEKTKQEVLEMLKQTIRPEFLNRIDETIMFTPLNEAEIEEIVGLQVKSVKNMLAVNGITLEVTPAALKFLAEEGYDPEFGARPVKRVIHRLVLNRLSKDILSQSVDKEKPIIIDVADDDLVFKN